MVPQSDSHFALLCVLSRFTRFGLFENKEIPPNYTSYCATMMVASTVSNRGLPSNNTEEADKPSVERVKLDNTVACAYDDVDEAET